MIFLLCRVCKAVSEYYKSQFIDHWKTRTKQECGTIKVVAALLVEKRNKMRVVTMTAGTKHKTECSYFVKKDNADDYESCWGLCDGHAVAVCYRLTSVYLMTEIYKLNYGDDSIFDKTHEGYVLKPNIYFHLFTSHPPCGFMAKEECHLLSWKQPFKGKPHSLQCSSQILISAYLGIQGFLSHLLVNPIYVTSVTIPRYETVTALHGTYITDRLQEFKRRFPDLPESEYRLHIPHVEIIESDVLKLFPECFRPYICEKPYNLSTGDDQLPQQETTTVVKQTNKGAKSTAFVAPDVIGDHGINAMVFTLEDGIGTKEFRESVYELKSKLIQLPVELKQRRYQSLRDAQIRLSHALNVSEALGVLKRLIIQKIDEKYTQRCKKAEELIPLLVETKECKTEIEELKGQVCKLQEGLGRAMQMNNLKSIVNALSHNLDYQVMLNDLESLLEEEKSHSSDPAFYLNLMGCNWVRYIKTIQDNIK